MIWVSERSGMAVNGVLRSAQIPHNRTTSAPRIVRKRFLRQPDMILLIIGDRRPCHFPPWSACPEGVGGQLSFLAGAQGLSAPLCPAWGSEEPLFSWLSESIRNPAEVTTVS